MPSTVSINILIPASLGIMQKKKKNKRDRSELMTWGWVDGGFDLDGPLKSAAGFYYPHLN